MNLRSLLRHVTWTVPTTGLLLLAGCLSPQPRLQSDDVPEAEAKYDVRTVGDVTDVGNAEPIPVGGVGLVEHLPGTGGTPPSGSYRSLLEEQLRKQKIRNVKEYLGDPSRSLVLVSGVIPAGARKGDPIDLEITLPPESRTTSLRGGYLRECLLTQYDTTHNLNPNASGADRTLMGHPLVRAEGPLLVGFGDGDEAARVRRGRIWSGGRCLTSRPFFLVLKEKQQFARMSSAVADRINEVFQHGPDAALGGEMAVAKSPSLVLVNVPAQYKLNQQRYLRVVRLIPLRESLDKLRTNRLTPDGAGSGDKQGTYRQQLDQDVLNPARTVTAALRLEALGTRSVDALKAGLAREHPLVRFCCAESLAYLGSPTGGEELAHAVERHPALRAFGLTALGSLNEAVCHIKLRELLASPNPETRYGAFRALRALDENDPMVEGEQLNHSYWLHRVTPNSPPLVHVSSSRRAEIVLFGEEAVLQPPFSLLAGEFTLTAGDADDRCTVGHFSAHKGEGQRLQCSLSVEEMLKTMARLGATYPEAVEMLRQAHGCQCLSCRVELDRLPQAVPVQELARAGAGGAESVLLDQEIFEAKPDFGATPTLYQRSHSKVASRRERGVE